MEQVIENISQWASRMIDQIVAMPMWADMWDNAAPILGVALVVGLIVLVISDM